MFVRYPLKIIAQSKKVSHKVSLVDLKLGLPDFGRSTAYNHKFLQKIQIQTN